MNDQASWSNAVTVTLYFDERGVDLFEVCGEVRPVDRGS
jgi:hypothetical protein